MGNSGKDEVGIADCGVGSIVWVRRRNGSWWPGKILGPEELSTAHLVSPRSGTPVKLLGREDASVDWYNLEKSKRVKPFRCCEFDECIEKAEAALGLPPKKREKYARREDAILHALELEKQLLDDKSGNFGPPIKGYGNKSSDELKKESEIYSEGSDYDNIGKNVNLKHGSKKFVVSTEDEDVNDSLCPPEVNGVSQTGEDVHISALLPRTSGSQGLGLRSSRAKQKLSSTSLNSSGKLELDKFDHDIPISDLIYESSVIPGIKSSVEKKRKSAQDALPNESLAKRRDRRRALVQVLQKSEKLPSKSSLQLSEEDNIEPKNHANMSGVLLPNESNDCDDDDQLAIPNQLAKSPSHMEVDNFSRPTKLDEDSASESTESTETDSSKTHSMNTDEDGIAEPALIPEVEPKSLEISGQVRHGSTSRMMLDDNDMSHLYSHDLVPASLGVSKWQSKGKRNNRSLSKRSTKATDLWVARGSMYTANHEEVESDGFEENDVIERNLKTQKGPYYNQGYTSNPKTSFKGYDVSRNIIDWDNLAWNEQPLMRGYWEGPSNHFGPKLGGHQFGGKMKSVLEDVDLKVQTSYQREHVPMISLMSKLNGKAIVGHPIQVQILEYGSTDSLLEKLDNDAMVHVPWTTARRSANFRVQCPQPSTIMEGEANIGNFRHVNHKKTPFMKSSVTRKGISHGKSPKKSPKKGLSSSQKTRNLSAIGREQRFGRSFGSENKNSFRVGGLIKGSAGMATVACIPLKLVFSRLNEELVDRHNKI